MENSKSIHWLCLESFFKMSSESCNIIIFVYQQMWNEKHAAPTFRCWWQLFTLALYACMKQFFLTKEDIPLNIQFSKLVYSKGKITSERHKHTGAHLAGVPGGPDPWPFSIQSKLCPQLFNRFKRNALKTV